MIRNDLHVHSVKSACGFHTLCELVQIGHRKGMRLLNLSDHGPAAHGLPMSFGVLVDRARVPDPVTAPDGSSLRVLRGIEANVLSDGPSTDIRSRWEPAFDLISLGFHGCGGRGLPRGGHPEVNTDALCALASRQPFDILTHPCIATYPLDTQRLVELALAHGFALEVNNTNLRLGKTNEESLLELVGLARDSGALLVECSDGHSYHEIGENDAIEAFLARHGFDGDALLLNRDDDRLEEFLAERKTLRAPR